MAATGTGSNGGPQFDTIEDMLVASAAAVRPPERLTVSEAAAKLRFLNNPGSYVGYWQNEKTPYLVEPMDELDSLEFTGGAFVGPARTGKALALDTPIATPTGWTTMGEIAPGDQLFDERGAVCRVVAATDVMVGHDCYAVTLSDGEVIVADAGHLWAVIDAHRPGPHRIMTTAEIALTHRYGKDLRSRYSVSIADPLRLPECDLPVDPYVLGAWLGDGHSSGARIFSGAIDVDQMVANLSECGVETRVTTRSDGNATIALSGATHRPGRRGGAAGVSAQLRSLNMSVYGQPKYIPAIYLRASVRQRQSLLQGLMDTDGCADQRGHGEFCTTSPYIADGFGELLTSLGYKYCLICRPAANKTAYRFQFHARSDEILFRLPRKQARIANTVGRRSVRNQRRTITSISSVKSVPVRCIQVDSPSRLFLAGRKMVPTHNSDMFFNWLLKTARYDPADMMLVHMTQASARDWSQGDLAKALRAKAPGEAQGLLESLLVPGRQNSNVHDKRFLSGMRLLIKWPTITELSGKTIPRLWINDYDRMTQNVDKEGNPFDLTRKRAGTFKRFGMCMAEASPGFPVLDANWTPETPHQAPPTEGLLAIYNRGDRRRWYWRCPQCHEAFEPDFKLFRYPKSSDKMESAEQVVLVCPHDGFPMTPDFKEELNLGGRWVKDGQTWLADGSLAGTPRRSDIASWWLKGPAAAFQEWKSIVLNYLTAVDDFEQTGSEEALKTTTNVDQGLPYTPKSLATDRLPDALSKRAENWGGSPDEPVVPPGVRFLVSTIDVQKSCFVVQVHGVGVGGDIWLVDMFKIRKSERLDEDGERAPLDPAAYPEDWRLLIDQVILREYPLGDGSGRMMRVKEVGCDSGGRDGVTTNAYAFWRYLRDGPPEGASEHDAWTPHLHRRFRLVKGASRPNVPRVRQSYPDAQRSDRHAGARGDVPVLILNTTELKDMAANMLGREDPATGAVLQAGGQVHFPKWAEAWLYTQLTAEVRTAKGWENPRKKRNEAFDLLVYALALMLHSGIRIEHLNWEAPPSWAEEWDDNELVCDLNFNNVVEDLPKREYGLSKLAQTLG